MITLFGFGLSKLGLLNLQLFGLSGLIKQKTFGTHLRDENSIEGCGSS